MCYTTGWLHFASVLVVSCCFIAQASGSCAAYGQSCLGGFGKRTDLAESTADLGLGLPYADEPQTSESLAVLLDKLRELAAGRGAQGETRQSLEQAYEQPQLLRRIINHMYENSHRVRRRRR